jgi:5-formyltetrahydrofolate cyclo-ligase
MQRTKTDWRRELLAARRRLDARVWHAHSEAIAACVAALPELSAARALLLYEPIGAEPDPGGLAGSTRPHHAAIYVPGPAPGDWLPHRGATGSIAAGGVTGERGSGALAAPLPLPAVAVVPGVGFDPHGVRLGRGRGFYDRALQMLRARGTVLVVGVAFELQIVPQLPRDPWDQLVDVIVTERRVRVVASNDDRRSARPTVEEVRDS